MFSLRKKMLIGFIGLLLISAAIGTISIRQITSLGGEIGSILKENYISVIACQKMKETIERMDDGVLFMILGFPQKGTEAIDENILKFEEALNIELNNITLSGERESAYRLQELFTSYKSLLDSLKQKTNNKEQLSKIYFSEVMPIFDQIKITADIILSMNQQNMYQTSEHAKKKASRARRTMYMLLMIGAALAIIYIYLIGRWILDPIMHLTASVDEISQGNLDLVISTGAKDEIGHLSEAFNEMAANLRDFRRSDEAKMFRLQHSAQQTFKSLPNIAAALDLNGTIEMSTESAKQMFGLKPDLNIRDLNVKWLADLLEKAGADDKIIQTESIPVVQHFLSGKEHYFRPILVPITDRQKQKIGIILILNDITEQIEKDEIKKDLISTVSHQLKTPLTSLRMALHILLEEKIGDLNPKQADLIAAATEESEKLYNIIEKLLNLSRYESGKTGLELKPVSSEKLIFDAIEEFQTVARDQGIELISEKFTSLPDVIADTVQIGHVFANLINNSLKYTSPGGRIKISTGIEDKTVRFFVEDTGRGIPKEYLPMVFNSFFRAPGQEAGSGTGLGLSIVKEIIEAHGGKVKATSSPSKGSTFSFTLPMAS